MFYMMMKLMYLIYFLGLVYLVGKSISYSIFSRDTFRHRMVFMFKSILTAIVWPLSILSRAGRDHIKRFHKLN